MKRIFIRYGILLLVAVAFSTVIIRRDSLQNVSPCATTPGCIEAKEDVSGTLSTTTYGFPVAYRTTEAFRPTKGADYKEMRITQRDINVSAIVISTIFWLALLDSLLRMRQGIRERLRPHFIDREPVSTTPPALPPTPGKK